MDLARFIGDQVSHLLFLKKRIEKRVAVKIYSDSKATLDSIASTHQIEQKMLWSSIADIKQKMEDKAIDNYQWISDNNMVAYILTKEKKDKDGLDDMILRNCLESVNGDYKFFIEEDGECIMKNT